MYDRSDPRASLAQSTRKPPLSSVNEDTEFGLFNETPPVDDDASGQTWYARGQNFIVAYSKLNPGAVLERREQPDEYMLLVPDENTPVVADADGQQELVDGFALLVLPPGYSRVAFPQGGRIVRVFTTRSADLAAKCTNNASFAKRRHNIPELVDWPAPPDGYRIRSYSLDVPPEPGRFGRIFRCTTLMLNVLGRNRGARDITKISPHHHDDFEQGSLAIEGVWHHHVRWPWTTNMNEWREDLHVRMEAPSLLVIPPPTIHTSNWESDGINQLVDIYSPPRVDFSEKPGWVLNADDYPMPHAT